MLALLCLGASSQNVIRPFTLVYSDNIKGGITMLGNTVLSASDVTAMDNVTNGNTGFGNDDFNSATNRMISVDIDADATTVNSTSADLILPAGSNTIKFARLYWGGKVVGNLRPTNAQLVDSLRKVKIRKGTSGAYSNITAATTMHHPPYLPPVLPAAVLGEAATFATV